jgi:hypothetical protein
MKITVTFRNEKAARAMAEFCKRATYNDAYNRAAGETEEKRKARAYEMLEGLSDIQSALEKEGFCVR